VLLNSILQQAIGDVAVQLANDIEANNPGERGVWIKAAKELRFPCVLVI
jgi:tyrosinase